MTAIEDHARAVFLAALDRAPHEWPALLDEACGDDSALRARVDHLLSAHQAMGTIHGGADLPAGTIDGPPLTERPGAVIGPYKLLQQIGEGGMGVVFMAEQSEPLQRTVALKIIKPGMDTRQVIARFEAERQAVAMMDHPNIAKVLDAGTTDSGRPYFVMELVKGIAITKYCDEKQLPLRARLELFTQVCQAVQHAHQKGVIHRDIKPTNVLVAEYDTEPIPKVIDFGVAKATAHRLTERTMFTEFGQVLGTIEYMSPEQAKFNQLDIDTRSDIYSLGALLYELLAGSTPFGRNRLNEAAFDEMLRIIREEEPPKPSTRLTASDAIASIAAHRQTEPARLSKDVQGELDWIVMKALEKDRNRRYETANGLAQDIGHYLTDEPVKACPPSAAYRLRKFSRRNKPALITTTAVAAALVLGTLFSTWQAIRATKAEGLAETRLDAEAQARREAVDARNEALQARKQAENDRERAQANLGKAREAVQQITQIAQEELSNVPQMEGVRRELLESALQFYLDFLRQESNDPEIRRETAMAYGRAAEIHGYIGNESKADELLRESSTRLEQLVAESVDIPADRAALVNNYIVLSLYKIAPRDELVANLRRAIELAEQLVKEFPDELKYKHALSRSYGNLGRRLVPAQLEEAERSMRHGLRLAEDMGDQVAIAAACLDLGYLMMNRANPDAEQWFRRALAIWEEQGTQSSWHRFHREMVARTLSQLGDSLVSAKKPQEAAEAYRRSVDIWAAQMKDYPSVLEWREQCARNYLRLGESLFAAGQDAPGIIAYQKALELASQDASLHNELAWLLATSADAKLRDPARAVQLATRAVELSPKAGIYWNTLGAAQYRAGEWQRAVEALGKSMELRAGGDAFDWFFMAMAHWQLGHNDEAREWYEKAVERTEKNQPNNKELHRFRAETEELLKIDDGTKPK